MCSGIRQLQLMLIKVCLILGVEIHVNVEFVELLEPREDQSDSDSKYVCLCLYLDTVFHKQIYAKYYSYLYCMANDRT